MRKISLLGILGLVMSLGAQTLPIDTTSAWELTWSDEFDYPDSALENNWTSQNGATGGLVLCSRWRENAEVHDGILELKAIKETRDGQDWTCGNVWTKEKFHYGYYECRYKYAGATGTNNSFWMWPQTVPEGEKRFELDVNEGHYPNIVSTNIHNWDEVYSDGSHYQNPQKFVMGGIDPQPGYTHVFENPITTTKIRFSSTHGSHFHIGEFRIYAPNAAGYPSDETSETADTDVSGLENLSRGRAVTITASGQYVVSGRNTDPENVADGSVAQSTWIAQDDGEKWLEIEFDAAQEVGCVQFTDGWKSGSTWEGLIYNYTLEYWDGAKWVTFSTFDTANGVDFSEEYHTYGMLWNENSISYYFDGELLRREIHSECISPTRIYLSLAVLDANIAGAVTDAIDGTSMKVDYVRYYTLDQSAALSEDKAKTFRVYPNPATDQITIEAPDVKQIEIYNATGVLVKCLVKDREPLQFSISDLPVGLLILKLLSKEGDFKTQIIHHL